MARKHRLLEIWAGILFAILTVSVAVPSALSASSIWLRGHKHGPFSLAFSSDGKILASGSIDSTARLWESRSGRLLYTLEHGRSVSSLAFSPDGRILASGCKDGKVRLWSVETGNLLRTMTGGRSGEVSSVAFSPDGAILVSGSMDSRVRFWDAQTGELIRVLEEHKRLQKYDIQRSSRISVVFSPDGRILASGGEVDRAIVLWNAQTGVVERILRNEKPVFSLAFSPDSETLYVGDYSVSAIRLWSVQTGEVMQVLEGLEGARTSVSFSPNGRTLLSVSWGKELKGGGCVVRTWDLQTGKLLQEQKREGSTMASVAFSPDGRTLASGYVHNLVEIWNTGQDAVD